MKSSVLSSWYALSCFSAAFLRAKRCDACRWYRRARAARPHVTRGATPDDRPESRGELPYARVELPFALPAARRGLRQPRVGKPGGRCANLWKRPGPSAIAPAWRVSSRSLLRRGIPGIAILVTQLHKEISLTRRGAGNWQFRRWKKRERERLEHEDR
jgi:hypothetical protein